MTTDSGSGDRHGVLAEPPEPSADPAQSTADPAADSAVDAAVDAQAATRTSRRRPWLLAGLVAAGVLAVLVVVYLVDLVATSGEVERGTTIAGVAVGGLTTAEAERALTEQLPSSATEAPLELQTGRGPVTLVPQDHGLDVDVAATVAAVGQRSADPISRLTSFFRTQTADVVVSVDDAALTAWAQETAAATDVAAVEGSITVADGAVRTVLPVPGSTLDVPAAVTRLGDAWRQGPEAFAAVTLPITVTPVRASAPATQAAADQVTTMLSAPLTLTAGDVSLTRSPQELAAAVSVRPDAADGWTVTLDVPALRAPLTAAVEATTTTPTDASVAIVDGAPSITPSTDGRTVDWPGTEAAIRTALTGGGHTAAVAYTPVPPGRSTEQVQALGIREVIGEFTTGGFAEASGVNIRVIAQEVNGAIVQPGATFSLNGYTGQRTSEEGYVPAAVIQEGALSTAVGGGISQFATTLYNASYFAGMGDVTHTPHSFYISRYPPGREATVYDGEIDLAFSNDYDTGVLIETIWTPDDITVRLWGTKHVEVESIPGERYDFTAAPRIVKPASSSCVPSSGSSGFSIVDTRVIRDLSGAELRREQFTTVYNGQQNVVCQAPTPRPTPADASDAAGTAGGTDSADTTGATDTAATAGTEDTSGDTTG